MASKKNRSRKANGRSPKSALVARWRDLLHWLEGHRWHALGIAFVFLFCGSLLGGYWIARRLDRPPATTYARIEDIPGLPRYVETEPGPPRATIEEKPRAATSAPQVAAAAPNQ